MVGAFVGLEVGLEVVGDNHRHTVVGAKVRLVVGRHCNLECNHGENVHAFAIRTLLARCVSCHTTAGALCELLCLFGSNSHSGAAFTHGRAEQSVLM